MEIGTVKQVDIQREMQVAYLDYAMSVIVARALPDARDGLKPVHRRILYAMHDMGLTHDKPYKKSARIVGEVLGKYHPHGDTAVYDSMVRMAQDFSLRYMLVEGQGNFGSVDGDNPAAMRYTEARLSRIAQEMLADIDKETVDWTANFDETLQEPAVLPAALPNLLVNGASGIAVGMTTNIPPHNLGEVCDALVYLIDRYHQVDDVTVEELMRFIKGPDFPTGGILYRFSGDEDVIAPAYASGRGHFRVQARAHIEEMSRSRSRIVVTELPYQVNKTNLLERIAELARDGKLEGLSDLRDESDRTGMRIVIEVSRTGDARNVLADLYKYTPMQQTFGMTMLALVDGEPRMLSLRRALQHYIEHRREIIRRRSEHDLRRAKERAHILEGLLKALDIMDEVIQTIRRSQTTDTARANLIKRYAFSEVQAQAILDMPLKRLAALERKKLQDEYAELLQRIAYLEDLLAHPDKVLGVIKEELLALKQQYNDARRTQIVELGVSRASLTVQDMMADEPVLVALAANGVLLRESTVERRRGKLPNKVDDAAPIRLAAGRTHDEVLLFSADGHMARIPVHRLPDGNPIHPADLGVFRRNDRLVSLLLLGKSDDEEEVQEQYLVLATRQGRVKRATLAEARSAVGVVTAMNVDDGDELVGAALSDGSGEIVLVSKLAQAIRFVEADVRPMGLPAAGVWGMKLSSGDEVVALAMARPNADLMLATSAGVFKRTPMSEFPVQGRHGGGVAATRLGQKSGAIADAVVAEAADEFFSASRKGTLRKLDYAEIPGGKRSAQGKLLIQPAQGDTIAALLHLPTARGRRGGGPRRSGPAASAPDRPADMMPEVEETEATQLTLGGWVDPEPAVKPAPKPKRAAPSAPAAKSQPMARGFKLDEVTTTPAKPASRATKPAVPKPIAAAKPAAKPAAKSSAPAASKPAGASKAAAKPAASKGGATPKPVAKPAPAAKSSAAKKATTGGTRGRK
ncbi:MAG TPA: DNA gyrase subunit A [Anaerolineae bacterium]|nr:DNA gyrase subunit A [Anaerolineae bacterium]